MRLILIIFALLFSSVVSSNVDIYQWCQVENDSIKKLTELPLGDLVTRKRKVALAKSVIEFSHVVNKDYTGVITLTQKHQEISFEAAEIKTLAMLKMIEMQKLKQAIKVYPVKDTKIWDAIFDNCVKVES
tara:strand:+ start:1251 stop:1640 length:390 start_codon:yes stop_codon:yes gene_type:complete